MDARQARMSRVSPFRPFALRDFLVYNTVWFGSAFACQAFFRGPFPRLAPTEASCCRHVPTRP